jgi:hypothetical protein
MESKIDAASEKESQGIIGERSVIRTVEDVECLTEIPSCHDCIRRPVS